MIIVVGGGLVIDILKVINILVFEGGDDLLKYFGVYNLFKLFKFFFVILIILGIGFEVIMVVVVFDLEKNVKLFFVLYYLMLYVVIFDLCMI